jgi:AcrR family transcriptional regulator
MTVNPARPGTKKMILENALRFVSREGLQALTLGELAKAVGMSKSGLFAHFKAKDNLQLEVLRLATEKFVEVVLKPAFTAQPGEPRVRAIFENWIHFLNDQEMLPGGSVLIAASIELDDRPGALRDFVKEAQLQLMENIELAARKSIQAKHFRSDLDCAQFAWSFYSYFLGFHHFKRLLDDSSAEERLRTSFEFLIADARVGPASGSKRTRSLVMKPI